MSKFIIGSSLACLVLLIAGSILTPSSPFMWLANTSEAYNLVRIGTALLLVLLLVTEQPRNMILRVFVGMVTVTILATVMVLTSDNSMPLLDSLSLTIASISMGIVVLEINPAKTTDVDIEMLRRAKRHGQLIPASH